MSWAPAYCEADELRSFMGDASGGDDAELTLAIETASRTVDRACNRQFGLVAAPEARLYTATFDVTANRLARRWVIEIDDLMTAVGLVVETEPDGVFTAVTDFLPAPVNAVVNGRPWTKIIVNPSSSVTPNNREHGVRVTGRFGWTTVPDTVKLATMIQAARLFARRHAPFGVAGNPEVGQLRLLERLDVDVAVSVQPYRRVWGAV
jgi:hypothetical protein